MNNFFKKLKQIKNKNRGFTILETLVAIFILVLSITGPMVFAQSGLRTAFLARDQITAFFLAQDAIETIKNMRDDNTLKDLDWLDGVYLCDVGSTSCLISIEVLYETITSKGQFGDVVIEKCLSGNCPIMKSDPNGRLWYSSTVDGTTDSRFRRNVYLKELVPGKELQIVVEVTWTSNVKVGESRIVVQENIYNWVPRTQQTP